MKVELLVDARDPGVDGEADLDSGWRKLRNLSFFRFSSWTAVRNRFRLSLLQQEVVESKTVRKWFLKSESCFMTG